MHESDPAQQELVVRHVAEVAVRHMRDCIIGNSVTYGSDDVRYAFGGAAEKAVPVLQDIARDDARATLRQAAEAALKKIKGS